MDLVDQHSIALRMTAPQLPAGWQLTRWSWYIWVACFWILPVARPAHNNDIIIYIDRTRYHQLPTKLLTLLRQQQEHTAHLSLGRSTQSFTLQTSFANLVRDPTFVLTDASTQQIKQSRSAGEPVLREKRATHLIRSLLQ